MKIKVLQICGQLSTGGQEMMTKNFYKYINRELFQFEYVVYGNKIGDYEKELIELGAKIYHISPPNLKRIHNFKYELNKIMKENKYNAIHSHTYTNNGIVLRIAKKNNIPIRISHCHTTNSGKNENFIYKLYKSIMKKLILNNATHFIACSKNAGLSFYGKIFEKKGIIIKNGIDLQKFCYNVEKRNVLRNQYSLNQNIVLGHVGRFADVKNHKFLVDLMVELKKRSSKYRLVLIGDGELFNYIKDYTIEKKVQNQVLFLGNKNNIYDYLQMMDLFLLPSKYEGLPVSLIEAQSSGLKCIVSSNVSKEANITNTISYIDIDNKNIEDWCKVIEENSNLERLIHNGNILKEKGFDINDICQLLEEIYSCRE